MKNIKEKKCIECGKVERRGDSYYKDLCRACYQKRLYHKDKEKHRKIHNKSYQKNKQRQIKQRAERIKKDPFLAFKVKKRIQHNNYVRYNFKKASCEKCFEVKPIKEIQIHHPDWENPDSYQLLCKPCHHREHHGEN